MVTPGVSEGSKLGDYLASEEKNRVSNVAFSVGAESANTIIVGVQLKDGGGANIVGKKLVEWWLSDTPGAAETGTGPVTSAVVSGGVSKKVTTAKIAGEAVTDANGALIVTMIETGTDTWYLNVAVGGKVFSSGAIAFTT